MSLSTKTRQLLRDLLMADEERRQIEESKQADARLLRSVDRFETTVNEFLECAPRNRRHEPASH
jgi:hypothetical protein